MVSQAEGAGLRSHSARHFIVGYSCKICASRSCTKTPIHGALEQGHMRVETDRFRPTRPVYDVARRMGVFCVLCTCTRGRAVNGNNHEMFLRLGLLRSRRQVRRGSSQARGVIRSRRYRLFLYRISMTLFTLKSGALHLTKTKRATM